ncbi:MAG: putative transporter YwfM [Nocardia sp.]|nr:putative transporter YwfM [Nocardia sp.]
MPKSSSILAAAVLWGSTGTAASLAPTGTPAAAVGSAGLVFGGLLLLLTSRGNRLHCNRFECGLLTVGGCAVAAYPLTFYPAVARTGVAVATVTTLASAPVFTGLLVWITGRGRPENRWLAATGVAVIGCLALVLGSEFGGASTPIDPLGVALALCAGLAYASYLLVGGELIARGQPSSPVMGAMFGMAALLVLPVLLSLGIDWLATPRGLTVALYLAVFTTFLAYRLFGYGLRHTAVDTAATLTLTEAAVAAALGVTVVGERLSPLSWSGMAVLALGLVLLTLPARRRNAPASSAFASRRSTQPDRPRATRRSAPTSPTAATRSDRSRTRSRRPVPPA